MQTTIVSDSIQQTICQAQKHVVDIQNWKKFKISDLFLVNPVKKLTVPGNTYLMDTYVVSEDGEYPYVAAVSRDNGVTGYTHFEPTNKGDCITMSTTADSSATVFYKNSSSKTPHLYGVGIRCVRKQSCKMFSLS